VRRVDCRAREKRCVRSRPADGTNAERGGDDR
jgi:hypothetical protein